MFDLFKNGAVKPAPNYLGGRRAPNAEAAEDFSLRIIRRAAVTAVVIVTTTVLAHFVTKAVMNIPHTLQQVEDYHEHSR